jgi:FemAB-related protein (PEP-CTERM system-associated)
MEIQRRIKKMETPNSEASLALLSAPTETPTKPIVTEFGSTVATQWDEFVLRHPRGTFFHLTGWKSVLERTFGFKACYRLVRRAERITGIAPFFLVSNWVTGKCLISIPFAAYGGIVAEDEESEAALLAHMRELANAENVQFLEIRERDHGLYGEFQANPRYATFTIPLETDPERNLKRFPRDTRYMIRKGEKAGLTSRTGPEQIGPFYQLLATNYHKLGTPVFPRKLFDNLLQSFGEDLHLLLVYAGKKPVSGVLCFKFRDTILPYYSGATADAPKLAANNFMYWDLIKHACSAGFRSFDFGRSKVGTGSYAFKTQWNAIVQSLNYQVFLVRRKTMPNFSPLNPKFEMASRIWRRLPYWMTTRMGPRVVRWFP